MLRLLTRGARVAYGIKYSRFYLEDLARDRVAEQKAIEEEQERIRIESIQNLPANDSNPRNIVKVRLNHSCFGIEPKKEYVKQSCWIMQSTPVQITPRKTISATRKYIITSIKKAKAALSCIRGLHIIDAISRIQNSHKKVAKVMLRTFYNLIDHAKSRDFNPLHLWVHGCIIGKTQRYKGMRYHAKGRGNREKRDFCQVKIIMYEKPEHEFFEEIAVGKCAPGVANVIRFTLKEGFDYQTLAAFTGIVTARGRQQMRLIFKRRIDQIMIQNEQQGKFEPRKFVQARLRKQEGVRMQERFRLLEEEQFSSVRLRQRLFKKNMGL